MEKTEKLKQFTKAIYNSAFTKAFLVNILFLALSLLLCEQKYEVSDDFVMETVLSGAYGTGLNPRILFSNTIYGFILIPLYRLIPNISWYFILQLVSGFVSFTAVSYIIFRELDTFRGCFFTVFMLAFFSNDIYILTNFTKIAGLCIIAGSVLVLYALFRSRLKSHFIIGALLCVLGSLQRFHSLYLAGPFVAAILAAELIRFFITQCRENKRVSIKDKNFLKILLGGFALIALILLCRFIGNMSYKISDEYRDYRRYASVRARIADAKHYGYDVYKEDFQRLGISENDYAMLRGWNFADPEYFPVEKLEKIAEVMEENNAEQFPGLRRTLRDMKERGYLKYPIVIACIIMALLGLVRNTRYWWFYFVSAGIGGCLLLYFFIRGRVLYRVEYPIMLGVFASMLYVTALGLREKKNDNKIFKIFAIAGTAVFIAVQARTYIPDNGGKAVQTDDRKAYLDEVFYNSWDYNAQKYTRVTNGGNIRDGLIDEIKSNPDNFYMLDFNTTIQTLYYDWSVYESLGAGYYNNFAYLSGVTMEFPDVSRLFENNGIDNPLKDLVKENIYLVDNLDCEKIVAYLREHYFPEAKAELVKSVEGYNIWKIRAE